MSTLLLVLGIWLALSYGTLGVSTVEYIIEVAAIVSARPSLMDPIEEGGFDLAYLPSDEDSSLLGWLAA